MALINPAQIAGMNTHYYYYTTDYFLDAQREAGIDSIALHARAPHFYLDHTMHEDCEPLRIQAEYRGLEFVAFCAESPTYAYQLCAGGEPGRQRSMDYFRHGMAAAAGLGAKIVCLSPMGGCFDEEPEAVYDRAARALSELAPEASALGLTIAVKTLTPREAHIINTLPELARLLREVNHPAVKASLDLVSMGTAGETPEMWFDALGGDIVFSAFVDGRPAGRLVWGDGLFPLTRYLEAMAAAGYTGYLCQEITDGRYFAEPARHDRRNVAALRKGAGL